MTKRTLVNGHIAEVHRKAPRHCHKLIRETAQAMAADFYETAAKDNLFHRQFPSQKQYVQHKWGAFVDAARETLAKMLGMNYPDSIKAPIYEALLMDTAARGGDVQEIN